MNNLSKSLISIFNLWLNLIIFSYNIYDIDVPKNSLMMKESSKSKYLEFIDNLYILSKILFFPQ